MFRDIATAQYPLEALVKFALKQKGAEIRPDTVVRYTEMLETAILIDDGEDVHSDVAEFINALPTHNKFEAVIHTLGETLGASTREIQEFMMVTDGVIAVSEGQSIDSVEATLMHELGEESAELDDSEPYAHLDANTAEMWTEHDEANRRPDPSRPEPDHLEEINHDA
jgi:hypothetical protein